MKKEALLVSACLLGEKCRYDGGGKYCAEAMRLAERYEFVPVCPEVLGGMPTPRPPSEILGDRVIAIDGSDVTAQFRLGAQRALAAARKAGAVKALLKSGSPSCGRGLVHDGLFSGKLVPGNGVTTALLEENGIAVCTELDFAPLES
ncbi:MAG: purine-nucleoside phosphorylase [Elusimicrobia bacterium GWC2_64_44]|nr:MAG: purine-nucleoside phosphorylase [Elusimicrobia bacterium GWC2_64_44]